MDYAKTHPELDELCAFSGSGDRGSGSRGCGSNKGIVLLIFATNLDDGPENIGRLAGRGNQIESAIVKRVKVLIPIRQTRGDNHASMPASGAAGLYDITIITVGEPAVAKDEGNVLCLQRFLAFTYT
jgi:hypothetical protein